MDKLTLAKLKTLTILYVEDEEGIRKKISDSLRYYANAVIEAENGEEAYRLYLEKEPDMLYTDIMMPKVNGIELVKRIRQTDKEIPIVMITAYTDKDYLLNVVDLYLEQYIVKPINLRDLEHSLEKCLDTILKYHSCSKALPEGYRYDFDTKQLSLNGEDISLSKKEILFFELLLYHSHRVVTYAEIEASVWEEGDMTEEALKSLVRNMRQKLPKGYIKNLSGIGYRLNDDTAS